MSEPRILLRYGAVALIVLSIGYVYVVRQIADRAQGGETTLGVVDPSARAKVGEQAPDFVLEDAVTGRPIRLSDYRGRTVVLNFWATWCVPCREEMPDLQRAFEAGRARGDVVVLGVNDKEPASVVTAYTKEVGATFPIGLDRTSAVRSQYGVVGLPGTFFIDRDGVIRSQNFGPVGTLLAEGIAGASRGTTASPASAADPGRPAPVASTTPAAPASKPAATDEDYGY